MSRAVLLEIKASVDKGSALIRVEVRPSFTQRWKGQKTKIRVFRGSGVSWTDLSTETQAEPEVAVQLTRLWREWLASQHDTDLGHP